MNMRMDSSHLTPPQADAQVTGARVVLVTQSSIHAFWLAGALGNAAQVIPVAHDVGQLHAHIEGPDLGLVVVDFSAPATDASVELVTELRNTCPGVLVIGAGAAAEPTSMRAALRCGVAEFIDWYASEAEARAVIEQQLQATARPSQSVTAAVEPEQSHVMLPLLGGRVGMGVTTLATHLAVMLQEMQAHDVRGANRRQQVARSFASSQLPTDQATHAALVDLGLPARDGLLYLNMAGNFSFVDAVQNLRRLDSTLLASAVEKHASGAAALAWPTDLSLLREVSPASAAAVLKALRGILKAQVIDLGCMVQADFLAPVLHECGAAWVVCDQSLGGIVSTAQMLKELDGKGVDRSTLKLVINRFNPQAGLPVKEVAQRLGLELLQVIPDRGAALLGAASCGQLLSQTLRGDPYVTSIRSMARSLLGEPMPAQKNEAPSPGILGQWAKRWRKGE